MNLWFPQHIARKLLRCKSRKQLQKKQWGCVVKIQSLCLSWLQQGLCRPASHTLPSREPLGVESQAPCQQWEATRPCLSDAESTNLQWLCSKGRSRKPGPQHCFPDMSSDGGEPWKQERRPFGDRERFPMRPLDSPLQSHISFCISRIQTQLLLSQGRQTQTRAHYHPCSQNQPLERGFLPYSYNFFFV